MNDMPRRLAAEAFGTAMLVAGVVGSGIMAQRLTNDGALILLCNALATGAILTVLITILGPISGAHLNPAVTTVLAIRGDLTARAAAAYIPAQIGGGIAGTALAHLMFEMPAVTISLHGRAGVGQWLSEFVAAFGLVTVILLGGRSSRSAVPWLVGLYICSAYWFTGSTSFANPAVTIARALTSSFAGIAPQDTPAFIAAQLLGALAGLALVRWLAGPNEAAGG